MFQRVFKLFYITAMPYSFFWRHDVSCHQISQCVVQSLHTLLLSQLHIAIYLVYLPFTDNMPNRTITDHDLTGWYSSPSNASYQCLRQNCY